jgi:aminoglycoside phosphotransferase (APT) family kinase protein
MVNEIPPAGFTPNEDTAAAIVERVLARAVAGVSRFPTGRGHYVYDIALAGGRRCVVRLTRPDLRRTAAGAVYWHGRLKRLGVPVPELYYADPDGREHEWPVLIMERLPGADLGHVYPRLTAEQKRSLAVRIADIQRRVAALPSGPGYGYATSYDDAQLHPTWKAALDAELARSTARLKAARLFDPGLVEPVQGLIDARAAYWARVRPHPYLDDTTTKNVIVGDGRLSGIVDTDYVAFGDRLMPLALTQASLLASGFDTEYVDAWQAALDLTAEERAIVPVYTALYCADFLAEFGHTFSNRDAPEPIDHTAAGRIQGLLRHFVRRATTE